MIDNGTQPAGRIFPNLHAHQGRDIEYLRFEEYTGVTSTPISGIPENYNLSQNYPNPFNPTTNITFDIKEAGKVTLKVYNVRGQEVCTLVNNYLQPGTHNVTFDAAEMSSGVYFYTLKVNGFKVSKKMLLMR